MNPADESIASAIAALEAQRALLGDEVVDQAIASLRAALPDAAPTPDDAARLTNVTVLFADMVGIAELRRVLDLEDLDDLTIDTLQRWTRVVEAHRGRVFDYAGDGVLAVFGADGVREDDAERAVRAGLEIAASIADARGPEAAQRPRVGVHTGPALVLRGGASPASIRGGTVNVAARMEQSAPPGRVRISQDCFRLVRGAFDLEAQPPLALKGVGDAVQTYLVVRATTRPFDASERGIDGLMTPLIGRGDELRRLRVAHERSTTERRLVRVTVVGEAGMGKTRLLADFDRTLDARVRRFFGRARPDDHETPYALVRDVLRRHGAIDETDAPDAAWEKLLAVTRPQFDDDAPDLARWIARMIGIEPPVDLDTPGLDVRQLRAQAFHATAALFRRIHEREQRPLALFVEDLHWADDASLLFLDHFAETCGDLPILVVGLTRPTDSPAIVPVDTERVELAPLPADDRTRLADALLARFARPPARLRDLLVEQSDGNPFFAEEILARLIDRRVVAHDGTVWSVDEDALERLEVPSTLAGLIQSRIDGLSARERDVLQAASVVGHRFWDDAVASLEADAPATIPRLVRRDLTAEQAYTTFPGTREYAFRHHLLHQVAYESVLRGKRREHHRRAAEWLLRAERRGAFVGQIAEHYVRAEDPVNAVTYLRAAADEAARTSGHEAAGRLYGRALALMPADDLEARFDLHQRRRDVIRGLPKRAELAEDVAALEDIADRLDDDDRRLIAANARAALELVLGRLPQTCAAAQRAIALADAAGRPWDANMARLNWSRALLADGDIVNARRLVEEAIATLREDFEDAPGLLNQLGILAGSAGHLAQAASYFAQTLAAARRMGALAQEAAALANLANLQRHLGRFDEAERHLADARVAIVRSGRKVTHANLSTMLALTARAAGRPETALARIDDALREMAGVEDPDLDAMIRCIRGHVLMDLSRLDEGRTAYEHSLAAYEALGRTTVAHEPRAGVADFHLARDDAPRALETLAPIIATFERGEAIDQVDDPIRLYVTVFRTLRATGDPRARDWLAAGHRVLTARADGLDDDDRATFFARIASNRDLLAAWEAESASRRHS